MAFKASLKCSEDPAEVGEDVYLGRATPEATILFKAHIEICPRCCQLYEETIQFVEAIRAAAELMASGDRPKVN